MSHSGPFCKNPRRGEASKSDLVWARWPVSDRFSQIGSGS